LGLGKKKVGINEDLALVASNKKGVYYMDSSRGGAELDLSRSKSKE